MIANCSLPLISDILVGPRPLGLTKLNRKARQHGRYLAHLVYMYSVGAVNKKYIFDLWAVVEYETIKAYKFVCCKSALIYWIYDQKQYYQSYLPKRSQWSLQKCFHHYSQQWL